MRLISVEALAKLVQVKEKADDPETLKQIRQLLKPFEYTKIDRIIDVVFTTTTDVEAQASEDETALGSLQLGDHLKQDRTNRELISLKREQTVEAFAKMKGKELVRQSRTSFWSPDKEMRVCCAVSEKIHD
jgi:hypothetical protein